jgi:excisionase family DNA binding protein
MTTAKLLNVAGAAELLGIPPSAVRRLVRDNQIGAIKHGHRLWIPQRAIDAWIASATPAESRAQ